MTPYTEQLDRIKTNLALVESVFARYPELFAGATFTTLDGKTPQVDWWAFHTTVERRIALAHAFPTAGWQRVKVGKWISWVGIVAGVQFDLENMETNTDEPIELGPVRFPETLAGQVSEMIQRGQRLDGVKQEA